MATIYDKAREILADYDAGRPLQVQGEGWLVRMSAAVLANNSRVGDKVTCNGYPGTVIRTKDSPGSSWMGGMVEVRLASGVVCVTDNVPDVVPNTKTEE